MDAVEEMLLKSHEQKKQEASTKSLDQRVCGGGCGNMVKLSDLSPSRIKYKKFNCVSCEKKRKEKYHKKK